MITKYYNASNHFSAPILKQPKHQETIVPQKPPKELVSAELLPAPVEEKAPAPRKKGGLLGGLFGGGDGGGLLGGLFGGHGDGGGLLDRFEEDDLILLGLLLLLINDSDDNFLTLIVGYLFIAGL